MWFYQQLPFNVKRFLVIISGNEGSCASCFSTKFFFFFTPVVSVLSCCIMRCGIIGWRWGCKVVQFQQPLITTGSCCDVQRWEMRELFIIIKMNLLSSVEFLWFFFRSSVCSLSICDEEGSSLRTNWFRFIKTDRLYF